MKTSKESGFLQQVQTKLIKYFNPEISDSQSLFHYTNNAGILGIFESSSLWATDSLYLNDSSEQEFGKNLLLSELKNKIDKLKVSKKKKNIFKFMVDMGVKPKAIQQRMYIVSFCEDGDLLSQWRGYAGSAGVSIGFNKNFFESAIKSQNYPLGDIEWGFYKVAYGEHAKNIASELSDIILSDLLFVYENNPHLKNQDMGGTWVYSPSINSLSICLEVFVAVTKHEGFSEENEWRLVGFERRIPQINFRSSTEDLIPYMKFLFPPDFNDFYSDTLVFETVSIDLSEDEESMFGHYFDKNQCAGPKYISEIVIGPTANFSRKTRAIEDLIKSTYYKNSDGVIVAREESGMEDTCDRNIKAYRIAMKDSEHLHQFRVNAFFDMPKIIKSTTPLV